MFQALDNPHPTKGNTISFWELGPYGFRKQLGSGFSVGASFAWYFGPEWNQASRDDLYEDGPAGEIAFEKTIPLESVGAIQIRLGHRWSRAISIVDDGADWSSPRINYGSYFPHYPGSFLQVSFGIGSWDIYYYRIKKKPKAKPKVIRTQKFYQSGSNNTSDTPRPQPRSVEEPKDKEPALIQYVNEQAISFDETFENNAIDAQESCSINFEITNKGQGRCYDCIVKTRISGSSNGLQWPREISLPELKPNQTHQVKIPITADRSTVDGTASIEIDIVEPRGFSPIPLAIEVSTLAFINPKLEVVDSFVSPSSITPLEPFECTILVQNLGLGIGENLSIETSVSEGVACLSDNLVSTHEVLRSGEDIRIDYDFITSRTFEGEDILLRIDITEKYGEFGTSWTKAVPVLRSEKSTIVLNQQQAQNRPLIERSALDIDSNLPVEVSFNQVPKDVIVETVAVLPIDGKDCSGKVVSGQDIASFTEGSLLGLYNVVERRNLERVLDEQRLALSGILYEQNAIEAGCNVGAQGIIFTEYGCLTGHETIQLKLVDCQTSELYWSATGVNATAQETLDKVRQELERQ